MFKNSPNIQNAGSSFVSLAVLCLKLALSTFIYYLFLNITLTECSN